MGSSPPGRPSPPCGGAHPAPPVEAVERLGLQVGRLVRPDVEQRLAVARPGHRPVGVVPVERDVGLAPEPVPRAVVPPSRVGVEPGRQRQGQEADHQHGGRAGGGFARSQPREPEPGRHQEEQHAARAAAAGPGRARSPPCRTGPGARPARAPAASRRAGGRARRPAPRPMPPNSGAPSRIASRTASSPPEYGQETVWMADSPRSSKSARSSQLPGQSRRSGQPGHDQRAERGSATDDARAGRQPGPAVDRHAPQPGQRHAAGGEEHDQRGHAHRGRARDQRRPVADCEGQQGGEHGDADGEAVARLGGGGGARESWCRPSAGSGVPGAEPPRRSCRAPVAATPPRDVRPTGWPEQPATVNDTPSERSGCGLTRTRPPAAARESAAGDRREVGASHPEDGAAAQGRSPARARPRPAPPPPAARERRATRPGPRPPG